MNVFLHPHTSLSWLDAESISIHSVNRSVASAEIYAQNEYQRAKFASVSPITSIIDFAVQRSVPL